MSIPIRRVYWDTTVFLSYVNQESEPERHRICEHILKKAQIGQVITCTSTFTIAEVIRPKGVQASALTAEEVHKLEGMFHWHWIKKYQVDETMGFSSARISRQTNLKPADSIHVATALFCGADVLHAWDRDFSKASTLVRVERPAFMDDLPLIHGDQDQD